MQAGNIAKSTRQKLNKTLFVLVAIIIIMFQVCATVEASTPITPQANQYLELRATEINEIEGQGKQLIMELWGNNIDFKRFRCSI